MRWLVARARLYALVCLIAAGVGLAWLAADGAAAQSAQERIESYDVSIVIQRNASIAVTERIAYDFASFDPGGHRRRFPLGGVGGSGGRSPRCQLNRWPPSRASAVLA